MAGALEGAERVLLPMLQWLRLAIEVAGALWIAVGFVYALAALAAAHLRGPGVGFTPIRLTFSRYLSLALEFQLAADILSTAIAPAMEELAELAVIAVIRTGLNYFLSFELRQETAERERQEARLADRAEAPLTRAAPERAYRPGGA